MKVKTWIGHFLYFMKSYNNVLLVPDEYKKSKNYELKGYQLFLIVFCFFVLVVFIGSVFARYVYLYGSYRENREAQIRYIEEYGKYAENLEKISSDEKEAYSKLLQFLKVNDGRSSKKPFFGIGGDESPQASYLKGNNQERFYSSLEEAQGLHYDYSSYQGSLSNKLKGIQRIWTILPVSVPIENSWNVNIKKEGKKIIFQLKDGVAFESVLANAKGSIKDITVDEEGLYTVQLEYNFHIVGFYKGLNKILVHKGDRLNRFDKIGYIDHELSYQLEEFGDQMDTGRFLYDLYEGNSKK